MPWIYDMGQTALLTFRRKAYSGFFFALKNPTASAGFEPANFGTKGQHATSRPPKPRGDSNGSLITKFKIVNYCSTIFFNKRNKRIVFELGTQIVQVRCVIYRLLESNVQRKCVNSPLAGLKLSSKKTTKILSYGITLGINPEAFTMGNIRDATGTLPYTNIRHTR